MRQGGQELVLPAVGVAQRDLRQLAIGQVDADADAAVDLAVRVEQRLHVVLHVDNAAVGADDLDLVAHERAVGDRVLHRQLTARKVLAVSLNPVGRPIGAGRRQRDIRFVGHAQERRERAVGGNVSALRIVRDGDWNRGLRQKCLQGLQALTEFFPAQAIERIEGAHGWKHEWPAGLISGKGGIVQISNATGVAGTRYPLRPSPISAAAPRGAGNMLRMAAIRQPCADLVITKDVHIFRVPSGPPDIS